MVIKNVPYTYHYLEFDQRVFPTRLFFASKEVEFENMKTIINYNQGYTLILNDTGEGKMTFTCDISNYN